jgi:hypothetical protein
MMPSRLGVKAASFALGTDSRKDGIEFNLKDCGWKIFLNMLKLNRQMSVGYGMDAHARKEDTEE